MLIPVKGKIISREAHCDIILEIHANLPFYVGLFVVLLSVALCVGMISQTATLIPYMGMLTIGVLIGSQSFWHGAEILDQLEHKLTRQVMEF